MSESRTYSATSLTGASVHFLGFSVARTLHYFILQLSAILYNLLFIEDMFYLLFLYSINLKSRYNHLSLPIDQLIIITVHNLQFF